MISNPVGDSLRITLDTTLGKMITTTGSLR